MRINFQSIKCKRFFTLSLIIIAVLFLAGCSAGEPTTQQNSNKLNADDLTKGDASKFSTEYTGSTQTGDVMVELTPKEIISGKLYIDINANTHSVSIDEFDLMKITNLEINGAIISPSEAPILSGHHASGTLVFDIGSKTNLPSDLSSISFAVTIKGIPLVEERVFKWEGK